MEPSYLRMGTRWCCHRRPSSASSDGQAGDLLRLARLPRLVEASGGSMLRQPCDRAGTRIMNPEYRVVRHIRMDCDRTKLDILWKRYNAVSSTSSHKQYFEEREAPSSRYPVFQDLQIYTQSNLIPLECPCRPPGPLRYQHRQQRQPHGGQLLWHDLVVRLGRQTVPSGTPRRDAVAVWDGLSEPEVRRREQLCRQLAALHSR